MVFVILSVTWLIVQCAIISGCDSVAYIYDFVGHGILFLFILLPMRLFLYYKENVIKDKPWTLYLLSAIIVVSIQVMYHGLIGGIRKVVQKL